MASNGTLPSSDSLPYTAQLDASASAAVIMGRLDALEAALNIFYILDTTVIIFFMQAGFALVEVGSVRTVSARDIMMKNLLDASVCLLMWWLIGFGLADAGGNPFFGCSFWELDVGASNGVDEAYDGTRGLLTARWLLGYMYAAASCTIVSGAIAERTHHIGYIVSTAMMSSVIYPAVSHSLWASNGWLSQRNPHSIFGGAHDFAGSGVVHITGGVVALCACLTVGPRAGRFDEATGTPLPVRGQSSSFIMLGTFFLWVGWLAFNMGSTLSISTPGAAFTAARVATRTMLSASTGCVAVTALNYHRSKVWSLPTTCYGIVAGLVAITASCNSISAWAACLVGGVGALLYYAASYTVLHVLRIDDAVDAFAVHAVPGAWGLIAASLFSGGSGGAASTGSPGLAYGGSGQLFGAAALAVISISIWAAGLGSAVMWATKKSGWLLIPHGLQRFGSDVIAERRAFARRAGASGTTAGSIRIATVGMSSTTNNLSFTPDAHPGPPSTLGVQLEDEAIVDVSVHNSSEGRVRGGCTAWDALGGCGGHASMTTATPATHHTADRPTPSPSADSV